MRQLYLFKEDLILTSHENKDDALELLQELRYRGAVIGTDEVGTGALAGPMAAAAVVLTPSQEEKLLSIGLKDSKKLSADERDEIFNTMNDLGVLWKITFGSVKKIEHDNILNTALWSMAQSVIKIARVLNGKIACVIVDGSRRIPDLDNSYILPNHQKLLQWPLVRADSIIPEVSAASVVAKVLRDRLMQILDDVFPGYDLASNKGYPTSAHRKAIIKNGLSQIHRKSFCKKLIHNR